MKLFVAQHRWSRWFGARGRRGLTLVELMVSLSIFSFVVIGVVYSHLFGLRQDQVVNSKLGASDQSRRSFDLLVNDVRSAKMWDIGNGTLASFTTIANGAAQTGNALRLYLTTDTNSYIIYYFDTARNELRRGHSGSTATKVLAQYLTNTMYFRAETPRGDVQTDLSHKGVINVSMQFRQYQYPLTQVGPGYLYDFYKMEFRLTPHVPDGI